MTKSTRRQIFRRKITQNSTGKTSSTAGKRADLPCNQMYVKKMNTLTKWATRKKTPTLISKPATPRDVKRDRSISQEIALPRLSRWSTWKVWIYILQWQRNRLLASRWLSKAKLRRETSLQPSEMLLSCTMGLFLSLSLIQRLRNQLGAQHKIILTKMVILILWTCH